MRIERGFARSTCDCEEYSVFCEHMPGCLIPSDLAENGPKYLTRKEDRAKVRQALGEIEKQEQTIATSEQRRQAGGRERKERRL